MRKKNSKMSLVLWGAVIGGTYGLMEAAVAIFWWRQLGSPRFFIRPQHVDIYPVFNIFAGVFFGCVFGIVLLDMAKDKILVMRILYIYMILMLLGVVTYTSLYWVIIKYRIPALLLPDIILFVSGICIFRFFMRKVSV